MNYEANPGQIEGKHVALVSDPVYGYGEIGPFSYLRTHLFAIPNVGTAVLATELKKFGVTTDFFSIRDPDLPQKTRDYDMVGISANTVHGTLVEKLAPQIKPPLALGGIFPSINRELIATRVPRAIRVIGEGEGLIPQILSDLSLGVERNEYIRQSLVKMETEYVIPQEQRQSPHLISVNAVEGGRGCPVGCNFCAPTIFDHSVRPRNIDQLKEQLSTIAKDAVKRRIPVVFVDNNLTIYPTEFLMELFAHINKLGLYWGGEGTSPAKIIDNTSLLDLMSKNCVGFYTGIEDIISTDVSPGKSRRFEQIQEIVSAYRKAHLPVYYSLVIGTDTHRYPNSFYDLEEAVRELGILVNIHIVSPHPGTPFYQKIAQEGRIIDGDFSHYDHKHVVFQPKHLTPAELQKGYFWLKRKLAIDVRLNQRIISASPRLAPLVLEAGLQVLGEAVVRGYKYTDTL